MNNHMIYDYSLERASIGSSLAAFAAGYQPKKTPMIRENPREMMTAPDEICRLHPAIFTAAKLRAVPSARPMSPPERESVTDSTRNWERIIRGVAPRALRIPISPVRSTTETSMMFMIPMPPTTSDIAAMAARKAENVDMSLSDISFIVAGLNMR